MRQYFDKFWNHILNENSQKQIIQKIFEKEKNAITIFFGSWLFQWQKAIENHKCVCAGARRKPSSFFVQFLTLFSQYSESTKKVQNIYWKYWNILQKYWKYWKHGSNNAWKQRITLSFCLKGTLRPNVSVQVYDSVEWQKHLILMSRGRKAKLPKLLKVN